MAAIFLQKDAQDLLKNKYIVVMGGSIQRSIYKDLIRILQGNNYLTDNLLRMKGEDSCLKDKLLDGGMRGKDKKGIGYREVRQYQTDFHFLQFVFMTRCYNLYIESVIAKFASAEQKPDVIIVNSCLWDITRYGKTPVPEYKENLQKLFKRLSSALPECLVIWNTNPAISHNPKGGVFIPGLDYLKDSMELHVLEANYYASKVAVENGHDVLDLHYFLRHQIHRRAEDGIHWDMTGHRRITNLLLTHIAQAWGVELPKHIKIRLEVDNSDKCKIEDKTTEQTETSKVQEKHKKVPGNQLTNSEKLKHDDIVVVENPKSRDQPPPRKQLSPKKENRKKKNRGAKWKKQQQNNPVVTHNVAQVYEYNHQSQLQNNYQPNPFLFQQALVQNQLRQQRHVAHFRQHSQSNQFFQHQQQHFSNPFEQQDFSNDNFQILNFDNGQWQPYMEEDPSYGNQRHIPNHLESQRFLPYARGQNRGRYMQY